MMVDLLKRLFVWLFVLQPPKKEKQRPDPNRAKDTEEQGRFYYLGDLLDRLGGYVDSIDKLRRADPDAYQMYKNIGGTITSKKGTFDSGELPASWADGHRPAFGFHIWDGLDDDIVDKIYPRFVYFWKEKFVPGLAYAPGDTYRVGLIYYEDADAENKKIPPILQSFYISVDADKKVIVLKRLHLGARVSPRNSFVSIPSRIWRYPPILTDIAKNNNEIQDVGKTLFCYAAQSADQGLADMLVRATRGGTTAAFAINMLRTPYFFKDRERVVNVNGKTRKIVHIVRAHKRVISADKSTYVKSHFRGLRHFTWNGFDVSVTMPGLHHNGVDRFDGAALPIETPGRMITPKETAERISKHISA